jgi:hypothetical protein
VNGVQRVKQKMRINLTTQRFELSLMRKRAGAKSIALLSFQCLLASYGEVASAPSQEYGGGVHRAAQVCR